MMGFLERLWWRYRDLPKWVFCCLFFRLYPALPRAWQVWLFNEVVGPFYHLVDDAKKERAAGMLERMRSFCKRA
jgi:hypothetical protein